MARFQTLLRIWCKSAMFYFTLMIYPLIKVQLVLCCGERNPQFLKVSDAEGIY